MNFDLSEDQVALRDGIRSLLEGKFPMSRVREGFDRSTYDDLKEAGVFSLRADGFGWADAAIVYEELGRALVPGPLVWSFGRDAITGGLDLTVGGTRYVEHLDALEALVVLDDTGIAIIDPSTLTGSAADWPLDPLTPVTPVELPPLTHVGHVDALATLRTRRRVADRRVLRRDGRRAGRPRGGLREGAGAVQPPDRLVPGGEAPVRGHGGAGRGRAGRGVRGGVRARRPVAPAISSGR